MEDSVHTALVHFCLIVGEGQTGGRDGHATAPCHRVMLGNEGRKKERRKAEDGGRRSFCFHLFGRWKTEKYIDLPKEVLVGCVKKNFAT